MITKSSTIKEVVSHNPLLELVLERFDLLTVSPNGCLETVAAGKCPDLEFLVNILRVFDQPETFSPKEFYGYPIPIILDYLYRTHRYYIDKRLYEIERSIDRLAEIYGSDHALLRLLRPFFSGYSRSLAKHIQLEEETLFPYVRRLLNIRSRLSYCATEGSEFDHYSLKEFIHSHGEDDLDEQLHTLRKLIERRHPELVHLLPFKVLAAQLDAFERDLYIHERIEDDVLIPLARRLEDHWKR